MIAGTLVLPPGIVRPNDATIGNERLWSQVLLLRSQLLMLVG